MPKLCKSCKYVFLVFVFKSQIQGHIDRISPKDIRDEDTEIIMGMAFGPAFLKKVYPDAEANGVEPFPYKERQSASASMPATGNGDLQIKFSQALGSVDSILCLLQVAIS